MKPLALLPLLALPACAVETVSGHKFLLGQNSATEVQITKPDGSRLSATFDRDLGTFGADVATAGVAAFGIDANKAIELGKQGVEALGIETDGAVATEGIRAGVRGEEIKAGVRETEIRELGR